MPAGLSISTPLLLASRLALQYTCIHRKRPMNPDAHTIWSTVIRIVRVVGTVAALACWYIYLFTQTPR